METNENAFKNPIQTSTFVKGIIGTDPILTDGIPQIAFIGRSNVGKSSLINVLTNKKGLAKSSSTPGKTSEINFFSINGNIYFVDLPGYGYAKVKPQEAEKFRKRIIWYLSESGSKPRFAVLILDIRRGLTELDKDVLQILQHEDHPVIVVPNKVDKVNQKERYALLKEITEGVSTYGVPEDAIIPFSALEAKGKDVLLHKLFV